MGEPEMASPSGASWRTSAVLLAVLALVAIMVSPGDPPATEGAAVTAVALVGEQAGPAAGQDTFGGGGSSAGDAPSSPSATARALDLPAATEVSSGTGGALPPAAGGAAPGTASDGTVPGRAARPPGNGTASPPSDDAGDGTGSGDDSPLATLAEAIPVPPDLPVPEVPEQLAPLTDAIAPSMFLVCSAASLPGGLASVAVGVGGGSVPGLGDLVGALLLYQVPILDLCTVFGFPDERVECDVDDQVRSEVPGAVPVRPPPPVGSVLGVMRGTEESLSGDTLGSDTFLEQVGCEARPTGARHD